MGTEGLTSVPFFGIRSLAARPNDMEKTPRIVGIDYGTKRVGLAVSDPLSLFARPVETCAPDDVVDAVARLEADLGIAAIVVGWPLRPDGDDSTALAMVQPFIDRLRRRFPGVPLITWDERFSSERAKEALYEAGVSRKARRSKERINAAAAAVILQEYLDAERE